MNDTAVGTYGMSKEILYKELQNQLFSLEREENKETNELVTTMAVEVVKDFVYKITNKKRITSKYVSKCDGEFSWENTPVTLHEAFKGTHTTNDASKSPFGGLTQQTEAFGRISICNAAAVTQARINDDFARYYLSSFIILSRG